MGYQNEGASPNKYAGMKAYCDKHVREKLSKIRQLSSKTEEEIKSLKPTFEYLSPVKPNLVPVAAIDGGMATLFPNEIEETKILKVASGCASEWCDFFPKDFSSFIHIYTGQLKWPEGTGADLTLIIEDLLTDILNHEFVKQACQVLGLNEALLKDAIRSRIYHLKPKNKNQVTSFEDNLREILEISAMVVFTSKLLKDQKIINHFQTHQLLVPYLLIKDGTLYPSAMTASSYLAEAVTNWYDRVDNFTVGVIKNSRFTNKENVWAKVICEYAKNVKSHTFFKIPKSLELSIDSNSENLAYVRFFLSLYGGANVYEVQVPKTHTQDELKLKALLDVIASQVTLKYGGSIITNSYAHEQASLPESEARYLTNNLRNELKKESGEK